MTKHVLVVKTSSMGDVIHTLPALTDAQQQLPGIRFDWVVEEGFAEIPSWHPAVQRVIPVALRRWRRHPLRALRHGEWQAFRHDLLAHDYTAVIDAQGLLKSAWLAWQARGPRWGYDRSSVRESLASGFYQHQVTVAKDLHAVERIRQLFAQALGYSVPADIGRYGLDRYTFGRPDIRAPVVLFLHGTTRDDKHWPEERWCELAQTVTAAGYRVRLPWNSTVERLRAERIARVSPRVEVLQRMNLRGVAGALAAATAAVAVDTGLGHLAAAFDVPCVSLYGPTSPDKVGAYGQHQVHLCASDHPQANAGVFAGLTADVVWQHLKPLLPVVAGSPA